MGLIARSLDSPVLSSGQLLPGISQPSSILDHYLVEEFPLKVPSIQTSIASKVVNTMLLPLSQSVLAANVVLPILATIAVVLRFVARKSTKSPLKADDYVILIALASLIQDKISQPNTY